MEDEYKLMDACTRIQAQIHAIENRLMMSALNGNMSDGVRREVRSHIKDIGEILDRIPNPKD